MAPAKPSFTSSAPSARNRASSAPAAAASSVALGVSQ